MIAPPANATLITRYMEDVWESEDMETYDRFHNAFDTVRLAGGQRTGHTQFGGKPATIFRFADGTRVKVLNDGSGLMPTTKPFNRRPR